MKIWSLMVLVCARYVYILQSSCNFNSSKDDHGSPGINHPSFGGMKIVMASSKTSRGVTTVVI